MTSATRRIVALVLVFGVQFALFEIGLRTWGSSEAAPSFQGLFTPDPAAGFRLKPGARVRYATAEFDTEIAINSAGVRDDEEIGPKAPDERRVVILGDSLVLAVQVGFAQTFGERLEARLNAAPSPYRWRVINAGVQGYGPVEEQLFFQQIAATLQPDVVLTTLFVGNDADEAAASEARLQGPDRPRAEALREGVVTRLRRLVRRSMVLQIVRLRLVSATERFTNVLAPPEPPLQVYATHPAPRIAQGLSVTRRVVEAIAARGAALGARTAIVLMPARFQVDDADYGRLKETVTRTGGEMDRDGANRRFAAALDGVGLPLVDVLPALRAAGPQPDLFFQQTVHLTPRGHEIVAAALEQFLRESGLAPPR